MNPSVYDLKAFYNTRIGRTARRIIQSRLTEIWPDVRSMDVLGCGYAMPYLRSFQDTASRVYAVAPAAQGAHHWPSETANLVCMAEESELPFDNASADRIILIHHLEYSELLRSSLAEIWRVLKPDGRLLVVVPNRSGFWARADWSPFGKGTPYSAAQLCHYLHDNAFVHERTHEALFMPPIKAGLVLKSANAFEKIGRKIMPFAAGLHMIEASKQIYAMRGRGSGSRVHVRGRGGVLVPKPAGFNRGE